MLNRINVKNFKPFKGFDYSCAPLNLLTGLNGSGKSSFVQLLFLLKAVSAKKNICYTNINVEDVGINCRADDFKYCYARDDEDIEVVVGYTGRRMSAENRGESRAVAAASVIGECGLDEGTFLNAFNQVSFIMRPLKQDAHCLEVMCQKFWEAFSQSPEVIAYRAFLREHGGRSAVEDIRRRINRRDDNLSDDDYNIFLEQEEWLKKIKGLRKNLLTKLNAELSHQREVLSEALRHFEMVSSFRIKPRYVHDAGKIADGLSPEGDNVVEFLHKNGFRISLAPDNPMRHRSTESKESSFLIDEVNAWLGEISLGAKIDIELKEVGDVRKYVERVSYGEGELLQTYKPQNVGFGVSCILPVLVSLLKAQPGDIIVIENPEAHLHPRGQSEMGRLMACAAAYGVQLFVETHSDHVINGVRIAVKEGVIRPQDAKIAFFERGKHVVPSENDAGSVEVYTSERDILIDRIGSLSEYPTDFMDEWNNQLMELM